MRRPQLRGICAFAMAVGSVGAILLTGPAATAASSVAGTVSVGSGGVAVRAGASTGAAKVGVLRNRAKVGIACQVAGDYVKGKVRKTNLWDRLTNGQYVSDGYVSRNTKTK